MGTEGIQDKYVNPYTDFGFKLLFGTAMNKELLISFLNALLFKEEVIKDVTYLNAEHLGTQEYDRRAVFDVYCENEKGEKFLVENAKKEGVIVTKSGLQYEVLKEGSGKKPKATDTVRCHYEGRLLDGSVFDSSYKRNEPADFGLQQVIAGWTEVMQLMPAGSKWEVYIPYDLAYGDRQTGKEIKPYSALIFTIELHAIEK